MRMSDSSLRYLIESFLLDPRKLCGNIDSMPVEEIVLGPHTYQALQEELDQIIKSYGGGWDKTTGFREIKIHNGSGYTRIRPHIREIDENR